ncbi:hypothetical protein THAOC_32434 [Thalassiosira oceanica]|uniref:Uncharacterized protein n=1 Tax=Thalassiosira oceanica TaxID=159749 RepID=K0RPY5_THAOC|nr:hypothetical protein THAOC_32434 [Thalassiosira oceanica]|eukprot:EJK48742.1 hypothetical protein THAOC_32434 [Thalassiosira oceanica]
MSDSDSSFFGTAWSGQDMHVYAIRRNDPGVHEMFLGGAAHLLTPKAWRKLGEYLKASTHVTKLELGDEEITDETMENLFKNLTESRSIVNIDLSDNQITSPGIQHMVPFLQNCCQSLAKLNFNGTPIGTESFGTIVTALSGGALNELRLIDCNIDSVNSLLGIGSLPNLKQLRLSNNNMSDISPLARLDSLELLHLDGNAGIEWKTGTEAILTLLQSQTLQDLDISRTKLSNDNAQSIVCALKSNHSLVDLNISGNLQDTDGIKITMSKVLADISTIGATYNSNKTLESFSYENEDDSSDSNSDNDDDDYLGHLISIALERNEEGKGMSDSVHTVGRASVRALQLNHQVRELLCQTQGVKYSYDSIFAGLPACVIPNILGIFNDFAQEDCHWQSESYLALRATSPQLISLINFKAMAEKAAVEHDANITKIESEIEKLRELLCREKEAKASNEEFLAKLNGQERLEERELKRAKLAH